MLEITTMLGLANRTFVKCISKVFNVQAVLGRAWALCGPVTAVTTVPPTSSGAARRGEAQMPQQVSLEKQNITE